MPIYEYLCEKNGRVLEVQHKMAERLETWGELCARTGIAPGRTDPQTPVTKLMSAGYIGGAATSGETVCDAPDCGSGACGSPCAGGMCDVGED